MRSSYVLICAAAGTSMGQSVSRVSDFLRDQGRSVAHRDVEDRLPQAVRLLVDRPRSQVVELWNRALENSLDELDQSADIRLISCHLTLYSKRTSVFFAPARISSFTKSRQVPRRVILLVDDVYDMHRRLSTQREVFDDALESERVSQRVLSSLRETFDEEHSARNLTDIEAALATLDSRVANLQRLLAWRRSEMIIAESLALQLDVPLTLMGVKHPLSAIAPLLDLDRVVPVTYVSHPISRLRREQRRTGSWPPYTERLNQLPGRLASRSVVGIMPTAIDELRFCPPVYDDAFMRSGGLSDRWPLVDAEAGLLSGSQEEPASLQVPTLALQNAPNAASVFLRNLEAAVAAEVPFRDHFLVGHCPNFLAFRPREHGAWFSEGVRAEIDHFVRLALQESERRMVVVHDLEDLASILKAVEGQPEADTRRKIEPALGVAREVIARELASNGLSSPSSDVVDAVLYAGCVPDSLLSEGSLSTAVTTDIQSTALGEAAVALLYRELTALDRWASWCTVIVTSTHRWDFLEEVAKLLLRAHVGDTGDVDSMLIPLIRAMPGRDDFTLASWFKALAQI